MSINHRSRYQFGVHSILLLAIMQLVGLLGIASINAQVVTSDLIQTGTSISDAVTHRVEGLEGSSGAAPYGIDVQKKRKMEFVGAHHPEDLVRIPSSSWLIASSMSVDQGRGAPGGGLYLIDTQRRTAEAVDKVEALHGIQERAYLNCPGPPPEDLFAAHGLAIQRTASGASRLLVVNHGGRESIEVFDIEMTGEVPRLHWAGCVVFPSNLSLNAVAPMHDGGFVATSMLDRNDPDRWLKLQTGGNTGVVYRWQPGHDPVPIRGTEACGDNGIEVGRDGSIYVAAWGGKAVWRFRVHAAHLVKNRIPVSFLPDNLRWSPDGKLLIAGQRRDLSTFFESCHPSPCRIPWVAAELDSRTMKITTLLESDGNDFSDGTTALRFGSEIWIGSASEERIAVVLMPQQYVRSQKNDVTHFVNTGAHQ
jgi:hypothetical protein